MAFKIEEIHAFICLNEGDVEGICAFHTGMGMMPMICADRTRLEHTRPFAEKLASEGHKIKLVKFTGRVEIEEIHGTRGPEVSRN